MSAYNLWQQFQKLLPQQVTVAGTVMVVNGSLYSVQLPGGTVVPAKSPTSYAVGASVFIKDGVIIGPAPDLGQLVTIEV